MNKLIFAGLIVFLTNFVDFARSSTHRSSHMLNYSYDVTGTDFYNTQTTKLCLLARLNASIQFSYRSDEETMTRTIFIPANASNKRSVCNFDFVSVLRLDFETISFSLNFRRTAVDSEASSIGYCQGCENGNWWLQMIYVNVTDTSKIFPQAPPTRIVSNTDGDGISQIAGGLITGVSLQRGYRCTNIVLKGGLGILKAVNLTNSVNTQNRWNVEVFFYKVSIQPFLVTNDIVKDPLLCKDFTSFLIVIILFPLLYFSIFIAYYRCKETNGLPKLRNRCRLFGFSREKSNKILLATSQAPNASHETGDYNSGQVAITCTNSEGVESEVLKTGTKS